jgi:hypothetical protein
MTRRSLEWNVWPRKLLPNADRQSRFCTTRTATVVDWRLFAHYRGGGTADDPWSLDSGGLCRIPTRRPGRAGLSDQAGHLTALGEASSTKDTQAAAGAPSRIRTCAHGSGGGWQSGL